MWTDASATHCFVALKTAAGPETHYMHAKWKKARSLGKLKGHHVTHAAWHPEAVTETSTGCALACSACIRKLPNLPEGDSEACKSMPICWNSSVGIMLVLAIKAEPAGGQS